MPEANNLTPETAVKGEAFILALIEEGHSDKSMKAAFNRIALRTWLRLNKGVVSDAAKKMGVAREAIFLRIKRLRMSDELDAIRQAESREGKSA